MELGSILASGAGAAGGIGQTVMGAIDRSKSKKIRNQSIEQWKRKMGFEEYTTPESYEKYRDLLGVQMRQEMPGATAMRQDIAQTTAAGLSGVRQVAQGADAMAGVLGLMGDRQRSLRQLGIEASRYGQQRQAAYTQAVGEGAQYEDKAFEYNQWLPWQMKMNEAMAYRGAGTQQITSGLDTMGAAGINYLGMQQQQNWFNQMSPQGGMSNPWSQGYDPGIALEAQSE